MWVNAPATVTAAQSRKGSSVVGEGSCRATPYQNLKHQADTITMSEKPDLYIGRMHTVNTNKQKLTPIKSKVIKDRNYALAEEKREKHEAIKQR